MTRYRTRMCKPCAKRRYATQAAAEAVIAHLQATSESDRLPVRTYQCHLGWWHLTSQQVPRWKQQTA